MYNSSELHDNFKSRLPAFQLVRDFFSGGSCADDLLFPLALWLPILQGKLMSRCMVCIYPFNVTRRCLILYS